MSLNSLKVELRPKLWIAVLLIAAAAIILGGMPVQAEIEEQRAEDIIRKCSVTASSRSTEYSQLWNDKLGNVFSVAGEGEQYIAVDLAGNSAQGAYIKWARNPSFWRLECAKSDGQMVSSDYGNFGYLQEYVALPEDTVSFRIVTDNGNERPLRLLEMEIFSPGTLPKRVHKWQPTPSTAEIMMIATHQDDEILYFGGAIPYYAGEKGYDTVIAYTAYDNDLRLHEALEGLWTCGARQHPVFFGNRDKYCTTLDGARTKWSEHKVTRDLTELMVRYRPQVVISQDVNGEYGHGQHLLTVRCVQNALKNAESADYITTNLPNYRPWSVSKCYLHLYWKNRITMQWGDIKLESAGGKTALQVAREAYLCHASQQKYDYVVGTTNATYDCRKFGLYRSTVGEDVEKNDFFENITLRYTNAEPSDIVPSWLQRTELRGWHYRVTNERWQGSDYLRCCTVNGVTGWYEADATGSLTEPIKRVELVIDDLSLDLSAYNTLTQISENPRVFAYNNGILIQDMPVRYCAEGDGETGFYMVKDSGGELIRPAKAIHVSTQGMQELELPGVTLINETRSPDSSKIIIVMCGLLVITAFALSISVARLSAANRRRSRQHSRHYPDRGGQRYR